MNAILITLIVCGLSLQHITKKAFNEKMNNNGAITFTALSTLAAMLFFVFQIKPTFDLAVLPYALGFGFFTVWRFCAHFLQLQTVRYQ